MDTTIKEQKTARERETMSQQSLLERECHGGGDDKSNDIFGLSISIRMILTKSNQQQCDNKKNKNNINFTCF